VQKRRNISVDVWVQQVCSTHAHSNPFPRLRFLLSFREVAQELDLSLDTVKAITERA